MAAYSIAFLCTLCIFAALQVPGTSAEAENHHRKSAPSVPESEIVEKHNELRRSVQPTASNMLKMSWSSEVAAKAQEWADTCSMRHSSTPCGENLYMSTKEKSWDRPIQVWYDENKDYEYGVGSINGGVVGHYTQVVWASSNTVGCAMANCPDNTFKYFYVCQYCPAGNYVDENPYKKGPPCGDCLGDCDNKLCTK